MVSLSLCQRGFLFVSLGIYTVTGKRFKAGLYAANPYLPIPSHNQPDTFCHFQRLRNKHKCLSSIFHLQIVLVFLCMWHYFKFLFREAGGGVMMSSIHCFSFPPPLIFLSWHRSNWVFTCIAACITVVNIFDSVVDWAPPWWVVQSDTHAHFSCPLSCLNNSAGFKNYTVPQWVPLCQTVRTALFCGVAAYCRQGKH